MLKESFILRFLWKCFVFYNVLDYHFVKTASLGKFFVWVMNQKGSLHFSSLISFLTFLLFWIILLIDDAIPWGESADSSTPYRSVYRFNNHFITSLKPSKNEKKNTLRLIQVDLANSWSNINIIATACIQC